MNGSTHMTSEMRRRSAAEGPAGAVKRSDCLWRSAGAAGSFDRPLNPVSGAGGPGGTSPIDSIDSSRRAESLTVFCNGIFSYYFQQDAWNLLRKKTAKFFRFFARNKSKKIIRKQGAKDSAFSRRGFPVQDPRKKDLLFFRLNNWKNSR